MEIEVKETVTRKMKVYPCIKCGSENIKIYYTTKKDVFRENE